MIPIFCAFLWRIGGAGWPPIGKDWRRIGVPIILLCSLLFSGAGVIRSLITAALLFAALRLPITFIGSSIPGHWFNWVWLFIVGYLWGLPSVIVHGWTGLLLALISCLAFGISASLSNLPKTAKDWTWEAVEVLAGVSVGLSIL